MTKFLTDAFIYLIILWVAQLVSAHGMKRFNTVKTNRTPLQSAVLYSLVSVIPVFRAFVVAIVLIMGFATQDFVDQVNENIENQNKNQ